MRAVVVDKPGTFGVQTVPDPTPGPGQVVVAVDACGLCGTDLHILDGEFPPTPYPIVPGHEMAGRVVAVGDGVTDLSEGATVAVDPSLYCGHCDYCHVGRGNLCRNWGAIGETCDGGFSEFVAVPRANAHVLPEDTDPRYGSLVEPLSCAVHAVDLLCSGTAHLVGARCLVMGVGTMGLLMGQLLRLAGAREVAMIDRNRARLGLTEPLGIGPAATDVSELAEPAGFDVAVDATGAPQAIETAFDALARGGTLQVFGVAAGDATVRLSPFRIYNDEIRVIGSMAVLHSFAPAVRLLATGAVQVGPLLAEPGHPLEDFGAAVDLVRSGGTGGGTKVQVVPGRPGTT